MTNEEKLDYIKSKFKQHVMNIESLAQFKTFIGNITPAKVRNTIKAELQKDIDTHSGYAVNEQERVDFLTIFKDEIDNL